MRKVLFLIPSLAYTGTAKQLTLLAAGLAREQFESHVAVLDAGGPFTENLRSAGVALTSLGWKRLLDARPFQRLRQLRKSLQPDVIHALRLPALRALALAGGWGKSRLVVSAPFPATERVRELGLVDRWLLRRADCVVAGGPAEAKRLQELGLQPARIVQIPPGVEAQDQAEADIGAWNQALGLPTNARWLVGVGPLEPHKGFRGAVWAFDILRYLYEDVHLLLIGRGSEEAALRHFAGVAEVSSRVHFLGERSDVPALLARAEIVWAPGRGQGGVNAVLEAMAAGRPVIAARLPGMAEIVADGETGFLIAPDDKAALARQTRTLLEDADLRRRLGEAGRKRAATQFGLRDMLRRWGQVYDQAPD